MRKYETAFIIDGLLNEADREALITKFENSLEKHGAVFERIIRWGKRILAYEIKKRIHGYYVIFYYEANPSIIRTFHHELGINENILRFMTLIFDGNYPDYIKDETITSTAEDTRLPSKMTEDIEEIEEKFNEPDTIEVEQDINNFYTDVEIDKDQETDSASKNAYEFDEGTDENEVNNQYKEEK